MHMYVCDKCGKNFKVLKFVQSKKDNGLIELSIKCPKCKAKYFTRFENEESLKLDKEMQANIAMAFRYSKGSEEFLKYYNAGMANKEARKKILIKINPGR